MFAVLLTFALSANKIELVKSEEMKKTQLFSCLAIFSILFFTNNIKAQTEQGFCVFEQVQKELERKHPEIKEMRRTRTYAEPVKWNNQIYEIPVVVHVIENRSGNGKTGTYDGKTQLTDAQIATWIENANKMFAATYKGRTSEKDFFPKGDGVNQSAVIPFKLVLAKRSPNCKPTTGIIRYDANDMPKADRDKYLEHGLNYPGPNSGKLGIEESVMTELAPHWNEEDYYNIYVVTGIENNFRISGILGYAFYPSFNFQQYHAVMKAAIVNYKDSATLAHEIGHSLGLAHTFETGDENNCPNSINDRVDDTEIAKSMLRTYPLPTNDDINPCTNKKYQGVQYNVMNYTYRHVKFTPGQRERTFQEFLFYNKSLTNSLGAKPIANITPITVETCNPTGVENVDNDDNIGAIEIKFEDIENTSNGYVTWGRNARQFYVDYANQYCYNSRVATTISLQTATNLEIKSNAREKQDIKIWIDYNDNGTFEPNEIIVDKKNIDSRFTNPNVKSTKFSITPPANAVTGKYLRMRVVGDKGSSDIQPCGKLKNGQTQDYLVKIKSSNTPKTTLTVTLGDITKVYDGNNEATVTTNDFTITGKQGNDDVWLDLTSAIATYDNANVGTNKTITVEGIALKGADASSYKLQSTSVNGTVGTITKKPITVTLTGEVSKIYDGTVSATVNANNFNLVGKLGKDNAWLDLENTTATYDNANVGTDKPVTVKELKLNGIDAGNYKLQSTSVNEMVGTITKKIITVTPDDNQSKEYGDIDPALTYAANPALFSGDSFSGELTRAGGEELGDYLIMQGSLSTENNYQINFITGKLFEITKATIRGITFDDEAFEVDGQVKSLKIKGNLPDGVTVTYTGNDQTKVGSYTVTAHLSGANYKDLDLTGTLTINRKVLISGEVNKAFTPNGDGINDFWHIKMLENQPNNKVEVYNRWGQLVFEVDNYDNNHNTFKGFGNVNGTDELPQGTYFYKIVVDGNMVKQGAVELRR